MGIATLHVVVVDCDAVDCEAEELFDPPHEAARRQARVMGWAITGQKHGGQVTTWCPAHRRYQRRKWTPALIDPNRRP